MTAEIITIGDELLIGQVVDTNSAWMAEKLNEFGILVRQITSISDDREHILNTLREASQRAEVILITGGLGPTKDDITKTTLCEYFGSTMVFSETAYEDVRHLFRSRGLPVTGLNRGQAMVPECCTVIPNHNGTAPGMWFEKNSVIYVSMPGVPFEMKALMTGEILPRLESKSENAIMHRTLLTEGIGESFLADRIESWENQLPSHIKLAYLPQPGIVRLRLSARGTDKKKLGDELQKAVDGLLPLAGEFIFGEGDDTLEEVVGKLLREKGCTLATAESCTGGYIAHLITSIAGSSDYFKGSVVAYANEIKEKLLGVKPRTLAQHGAVSSETVKEMAEGARERFTVDYAIATSGVAGPSGGTPEKPVGTTWIAVASPLGTVTRKFILGEHRGRNIQRAAISALSMLRKIMIEQSRK
ncbi:MAG TPA: competence/damage-inducible protein A [Bacteroidales bacterium]|nr:competence/damage-inducible protein A [Bacteroidales bacterium]